MISIVLIMLSASLNALMDTTKHHFSTSVFRDLNGKWLWFFREDNWKNKYVDDTPPERRRWKGIMIPTHILDSWHMAKSLMIVLLMIAVVMHNDTIFMLKLPKWLWVIVYGTAWNVTFSLFYDKILSEK